jgi:hypothetical protein
MSIFKKRGSNDAGRKLRFVALLSDTHGGNENGLLSPNTCIPKTDQNGDIYHFSPQLNKIQDYLYQLYIYHVANVFNRAANNDVIVEHDGDLAQGTKYIDEGLMSIVFGTQKAIAEENMRPWLEAPNVKTMRFATGTQAHEGVGNTMSYEVAKQLQVEYRDKDIKTVEHGLMNIDGFEIDYAHHGPPPGRRSWLKGNEARYYLRDRMLRDIQHGRRPPDLYHRAHYHEAVIEELRVNGYKSILVITPSYSFPGARTRQATASLSEIVNGMIVLEVEDGKLRDIHELTERTDIRTRETI